VVAPSPAPVLCLAESRRDVAMPNSPQRLPFTTPKRPYFIGPEDAIALRELYEELPYAAMRAAEALRTDGTILRGDDLLDFSRAEDAVTEIIRRISEILENVHAKRP
jgi:hypothetical protein